VLRWFPGLARPAFRILKTSDNRIFRSTRFRLFRAWTEGLSEESAVQTAALPNGLRLFVDVRDWCGLLFIEPRAVEPVTTEFLLKNLRKGDTFLDIGANVGYLTMIAADAVGESGTVWCFEPNPKLVSLIAESIRRNHFDTRIRLTPVALSDADHEAQPFYFSNNISNSGLSSLVPSADHILSGQMDAASPTLIRTTSLDQFAASNRIERLDALKIDVEGAEELVINGMRNSLVRLRPRFIICETGLDSPAARQLETLGYERHMLEPMSPDGNWGNILFQPRAVNS